MKAKYTTNWDVHHNGKPLPPDEVVELDDKEDAGLIASGAVTPVDTDGDGKADPAKPAAKAAKK